MNQQSTKKLELTPQVVAEELAHLLQIGADSAPKNYGVTAGMTNQEKVDLFDSLPFETRKGIALFGMLRGLDDDNPKIFCASVATFQHVVAPEGSSNEDAAHYGMWLAIAIQILDKEDKGLRWLVEQDPSLLDCDVIRKRLNTTLH